jgi:hypothetical protein
MHTVGKPLHTAMKKILLLSIATLAVNAISSWAAPSPYSQNIAGYVNTTLPGGNAAPINAPFLTGTNTVEAVMPTIKKDDKVSFWTGGSFVTLTYAGPNFDGQGHAWADSQGNGQNSPAVDPSRPFVYQNNGNAVTNTFVGSIPTSISNSVTIPGGHAYTMLVSAIPFSGALDSADFSLPFQAGDKVFVWVGHRYMAFTYKGANFDGQGHAFTDESGQALPSPFIHIGQGFFYQNNQDSAETWKQSLKL